jgi:hypothetical protein
MTFSSSAEKQAVSGAAESMRFSVSRTMSNTSLSAGRSALAERFDEHDKLFQRHRWEVVGPNPL